MIRLALLALVWVAVVPTWAAADLSSPRATMQTFLTAINDAKRGESGRWEDAVACLDVEQLPTVVRGQSRSLAHDLKEFLDKTGVVALEQIPTDPSGSRWIYKPALSPYRVALEVDEAGEWRFAADTVEQIPAMARWALDKDYAAGLGDNAGAPDSLADMIRKRVPAEARRVVLWLEAWQWVGLFVIVLFGVVLDRLVRLLFHFWIRRLLRGSEKQRDAGALADFERPVGILSMGLSWQLLLPWLDLPLRTLAALLFASKLVAAIAGVWAAYKLVDLLASHFAALAERTETQIDDILVPMLRRALKILVVSFGVIFVAQNLDIDVTGLVAGLGIGGLAFALAAKDTIENLFGSVTVLVDRPFRIGDWVVIGDQEGTVEEIGFRSTRIRTFYNSLITMPNSKLVSSAVDNLGARRFRRYKTMLGLQYDTPPDRIEAFCEGVRELVRQHPYTRKDYYMVYLNDFAGSSLNVLLYVFFETPDWATELREKHRLMVDIVRLAHRLGVQFAFPTQTLHLASVPPGVGGASPPDDPPGSLAPAPGGEFSVGREGAAAIAGDHNRGQAQPPVAFDDPERIRPDR